jgi:hypothetical protein
MPRFLPYVGWERRGNCKWHRTDIIVKNYAYYRSLQG